MPALPAMHNPMSALGYKRTIAAAKSLVQKERPPRGGPPNAELHCARVRGVYLGSLRCIILCCSRHIDPRRGIGGFSSASFYIEESF
jgi:hypothetical protein